MDYESFFRSQIEALKQEGRYRVFADLARHAGKFPRATFRDGAGREREITRLTASPF